MIGAITAGLYGTGVAPVTNSFFSIATQTVGAGGTSTITFSSIPQGYKHLQLRISAAGSGSYQHLGFNGSTSSYYDHYLYGDGSAVGSGPESGSAINFGNMPNSSTTFGVAIVDILDYTSTAKNKTIRSLEGYDLNGSGLVLMHSGLWYATPAAITSIEIAPNSSTYNQYSTFALYGVL